MPSRPKLFQRRRNDQRAHRELQSWRVKGNPPTLCQLFANPVPQPFADPSPTFRQPFANRFCQPLSKPLFPWTQGAGLETRVNGFSVHVSIRDAEMTIKIIFETSSQKADRRVNRGPTLKFDCRPKAQEKQHFGKSHFYFRRSLPGNAVTIILNNYPPSHPPGCRTRGPYESEHYCRREFLSFRICGRTDFSRIFIFGPPDFLADVVAGFFLFIFGKKCPEKSSRKIPGKIL